MPYILLAFLIKDRKTFFASKKNVLLSPFLAMEIALRKRLLIRGK